jgi:4-alpha-glucanotransferase
VGEDLGTVEPGVREGLARRAVLSTRLLWFEDGPPESCPELALAAVTTHDLPTIAGVWTGADLEHRRTSGVRVAEEAGRQLHRRLAATAGLSGDEAVHEVVVAAHAALGRVPSRLRVATLEDALGVRERPNMPGTVDTWPNWSLALPVPLEELVTDRTAPAVGRALGDGR